MKSKAGLKTAHLGADIQSLLAKATAKKVDVAPVQDEVPSSDRFIRLGVSLFDEDLDRLTALMAESLKLGRRHSLNRSEAVRLAIRLADASRVTAEDILAIKNDDRRRNTFKEKD